MKLITYVLVLLGICTAGSLFGEGIQCTFSSVPPTVFMITEPQAKGQPGSFRIYEVTRGGKSVEVIFGREMDAEQFMKALPDAKVHNRSITSVPKTFVREGGLRGLLFLLDPASTSDGGALVGPDVDTENVELKTICAEDQADRVPGSGKQIDWSIVGPRDAVRLARVKELYQTGKLSASSDYFNAALVLQHGSVPEDYLLAHELAIVAVRKGYQGAAAWLAAASEDRFLQSIGRKQRFGTQLTDPIVVDGNVTDLLRNELSVPPLKEEEQKAQSIHH